MRTWRYRYVSYTSICTVVCVPCTGFGNLVVFGRRSGAPVRLVARQDRLAFVVAVQSRSQGQIQQYNPTQIETNTKLAATAYASRGRG